MANNAYSIVKRTSVGYVFHSTMSRLKLHVTILAQNCWVLWAKGNYYN